MGKFNIGDKIIVTAHNEDMDYPCVYIIKDLYKEEGIICDLHRDWNDGSTSYKVKFNHYICGHNCDGKCEKGYGQYINEKYLKLYKEDKTMHKEKHEKKTWEQQIKERFEGKRKILNTRIGFTGEQTLVPKKFYYDNKTHTTIIDFSEIGKIKTKPIDDDEYNEDVTFDILAAKAIYKRFDIPFESDMSSLEAKIFAKFILHKNTGVMFDKYVKYLKDMEQTFLQEEAQMKEVEKTRKNQKAKNRARKAKQKAKKSE
ncbi:MAG TPA: hypothetical protein DCW90_24435 [Lachnospiraceae bacterium]|nr:hypothetical protein [Lachnospiraceae bacterium]